MGLKEFLFGDEKQHLINARDNTTQAKTALGHAITDLHHAHAFLSKMASLPKGAISAKAATRYRNKARRLDLQSSRLKAKARELREELERQARS